MGLALALSTGAACYRHSPVGPGHQVESRPPLVAPMRGRYAIQRAGRPLGEEVFVISTSSTGTWRIEGETRLEFPAERVQSFMLEVDVASREPTRFSASLELVGERQWIRGRREEAFFEFQSSTIAGEHQRSVPYALGTMLDFPSPLFHALPLALLGPTLEVGRPVSVRTIAVLVPMFTAGVVLERYELREREGGLLKVVVTAEGDPRPIALWVRPDGLPVRARTWIDEGPPIEMKLVGEGAPEIRAENRNSE